MWWRPTTALPWIKCRKLLYPRILTNEVQIQEWKHLFAIEEIERTVINSGYSDPLTVEFLKANPCLVLDTAFFDDGLDDPKINLYKSIKEIDSLKDTDVILNSFTISVTPFRRVNWRGNMTKDDFEASHVLFQEDKDDYIGKMFARMG